MSHQKIMCNVNECAHNCIEDSSCRLEKIQVKPCSSRGHLSENTRAAVRANTEFADEGSLGRNRTPEDETACAMFSYVGNLNSEEKVSSKQQ